MPFRVLIMRLSQFRDVVKSTSHQFLYGECARVLDDSCIDFAFLPSENARRRREPLTGTRSHVPASEFDLILVSNSYAVELINLAYMLKISDIPYSPEERNKRPEVPLVIMGGSNALSSQAILFSETSALTDAVYFGEGEQNVTEIVRALSQTPRERRRQTLMQLQDSVTGLRVFGAPEKIIKKAVFAGTNVEMLASARQGLFDSGEAGTVRLMISYDCPSFCSFCFEGWERKPYREVPFDELMKAAAHLKRETGAETIEITAFNFNTHTDVTKIITGMNRLFAQVNFMSQRADILASNSTLSSYEVAAGKRQYTLGAEGISGRMRSYFNKNLDEETLLRSVALLAAQNAVKEIKLFYIIAGIETDDDFTDFSNFLAKIAAIKTQYGSPARILCSFGLLVRMPFTPLQYEKLLLTKDEWAPVVEKTKRTVESAGYEFRLTYPYEEYFLSQTLVLTNQYAAPALVEFARRDIVYDGSLPSGAWELFTDYFPVTPGFTAEKKTDYPFAYRNVDTCTRKDFLYDRFLDAKAGKEMTSCMGGTCRGCGSCTDSQRQFLLEHTINMPSAADKTEIASLLLEKQRAKPVYVQCTVPEDMAPSRNETRAAYAMRICMDAVERAGLDAVTSVMTVKDALFGSSRFADTFPRWYGKTVCEVYPFTNEKRTELLNACTAAGMKAGGQELIPPQFSVTLENRQQTELKELEKAAQLLLDGMHLPFILSRKDGCTNLTIVPKALKKHVVNTCSIRDGKIFLTCTEKADFSPLLKQHFTAHTDF